MSSDLAGCDCEQERQVLLCLPSEHDSWYGEYSQAGVTELRAAAATAQNDRQKKGRESGAISIHRNRVYTLHKHVSSR